MIGTFFQDFYVLDLIGKGGMGEVYLALQKSLQREVALKVITLDSNTPVDSLERFVQEAKLMASIQHPNIVYIHNVGREQNFLYIAMEYIRGASLHARLKEGPLEERQVWEFALQICQALQAALQKNIIHRDIKPANILLTTDNLIKLMDFGLAKDLEDNNQLTKTGFIFGTPAYISPEQAEGATLDFRSDIYSLGATLYHLLTGHAVFSAASSVGILVKHSHELVVPPQELISSLRKESTAILGKMLNKSPQDRYLCYGDLMADIMALLRGKPLSCINNETCIKVYRRKPFDIIPTKKRFNSLLPFFPRANYDPSEAVLVSNFYSILPQEFAEKYKIQLHTITSLSELKVILKNCLCPIFLDLKFLGHQVVSFALFVRKEFPEIPVWLLVENIPLMDKTAPEGLLCVSSRKEEKLGEAISSCFTKASPIPSRITFPILLSWIAFGKWSLHLKINPNTPEEAKVLCKEGVIVQASYREATGQEAIRELADISLEKVEVETITKLNASRLPQTEKNSDNAQLHQPQTKAMPASPPQAALLKTPETKAPNGWNAPPNMPTQMTVPIARQAAYDSPSTSSLSNETSPRFWKVLLLEQNEEKGQAIANMLSGCANVMAVCISNVDDVFPLLEQENFEVLITPSSISRFPHCPLYEEIQGIFPHIFQILIGHPIENPSLSFRSPGHIEFLPDYYIGGILDILNKWKVEYENCFSGEKNGC